MVEIALLLWLFQAPPVPPQEPEKTVVVTPSPLQPREVFDTPYATDVVTSDDLRTRRLSRTLPDALREVPNVSVQKTSAGHGSPFIRGLTGFRNVLLIDGIRLNNSVFRDGPNQYWNTVDEFLVDRIEVVKGPSSVLYGSDSLGGTVNVITRGREEFDGDFHFNARSFFRYAGADGSFTERTEVGAGEGRAGFFGGATVRDMNDVVAGRHSGELGNTGYDEYDVDAKFVYRWSGDRRFVVAYQRNRQDDVPRTHRTNFSKEFHGTTIGSDLRSDFDQERDLWYGQFTWDRVTNFVDTLGVSLSWHRQVELFRRITNSTGATSNKVEVRTLGVNSPGAWLRLGTRTPIGFFTYGGEWYQDDVGSRGFDRRVNGTVNDFDRGEVADDSQYDLYGTYIQNEISLVRELEVIVGGRYNAARIHAGDVDPAGVKAAPLDSFERTYRAVVGSARAVYHIGEELNVIAGVSQGFRAPNFDDTTATRLVMSGQTDFTNPDVDPERSLNYELGGRWENPVWEMSAFAFYTQLDDFIQRVPTSDQNGNGLADDFIRDNVGEGFIKGTEFQAIYHLSDMWDFWGDVAYVLGNADTRPANGREVERPLSKVNPATGHIGARYHPTVSKYWIEILTTMVRHQDRLSETDETDTQRIPRGGTPGYTTLTLRAGAEPLKNTKMSVAVENVTDKDYRVHGSGQNEPGTNFIFGLDVRF